MFKLEGSLRLSVTMTVTECYSDGLSAAQSSLGARRRPEPLYLRCLLYTRAVTAIQRFRRVMSIGE